MDTIWIPFVLAATFCALCFFAWILSLFEGWQTRIFIVFTTLLVAGLGWIWINMGGGMVVIALVGGGILGLLFWAISEFLEMAAREREKREQDERNRLWVEQERRQAAERAEKWAAGHDERRRQEDERRAEDQRRAAQQAERNEARRQREEADRARERARIAAKEAELAKLMKDADPDTPML